MYMFGKDPDFDTKLFELAKMLSSVWLQNLESLSGSLPDSKTDSVLKSGQFYSWLNIWASEQN